MFFLNIKKTFFVHFSFTITFSLIQINFAISEFYEFPFLYSLFCFLFNLHKKPATLSMFSCCCFCTFVEVVVLQDSCCEFEGKLQCFFNIWTKLIKVWCQRLPESHFGRLHCNFHVSKLFLRWLLCLYLFLAISLIFKMIKSL